MPKTLKKPKSYRAKPETWDKFYFAPEFWLVTVIILGIVSFGRYSPATPGILHNSVVFQVYGTIGGFIIIAATNYLLERRDQAISRGFEPLGYRLQRSFEKFGGLELALFVANIVMLFAVLFGHMWTPKGDFHNMYTGFEYVKTYPSLWALPAINLLAIACATFGRIFGRRTFLILAAFLAVAYVVAIITFVNTSTNTAANSPSPDGIAFTLLIAAGLIAVIAPVVAMTVGFRKPRQNS